MNEACVNATSSYERTLVACLQSLRSFGVAQIEMETTLGGPVIDVARLRHPVGAIRTPELAPWRLPSVLKWRRLARKGVSRAQSWHDETSRADPSATWKGRRHHAVLKHLDQVSATMMSQTP